jgi:integrase
MQYIRRKNGWAVRFYYDGKREYLSGFKRQQDAKNGYLEFIKIRNEEELAKRNNTKEITIKKYMEMWFDRHCQDIGERTRENYASIIHLHVLPELGDMLLHELDSDALQDIYTEKLEYLSGTRVKDIHKMIKLSLKHAKMWGYLEDNPAENVKAPKCNDTDIVIPEEWQVKKILEYARKYDAFIAIYIGATTGMRVSEIMALKTNSIDFENDCFNVTNAYQDRLKKNDKTKTKSSKRRIKFLPGTEIEIKKYYLKKLQNKVKFGKLYYDNDYFCTFQDGKQLSRSYVSKTFKKIIRKLKYDDKINFKSLRHYHISYLISKGKNIKAIQERSGHATVRILIDTYTHLFPSLQDDMVKDLEFNTDIISNKECKLMEWAQNGHKDTTLNSHKK